MPWGHGDVGPSEVQLWYSNIQACYGGTIIDRVDIFYIVIPVKQWYSEVTLRNGLVKWGDVT